MYKIVICEDEDIIRKGLMFSFDFQSLDLKVTADFDNPQSCLDYLKENSVDIIITDIKMPLMTGLEMIEKIDNHKKYEFIILSGHSDFEYAKKAITYGVTEYLIKPLDHKLLKSSLKKAINNLDDKKILAGVRKSNIDNTNVFTDLEVKDKLLQSIILFIKENYMHKVILDDVAESLNYSVSTIKNKLKEYDLKFNKTLNRYRMYKAIEMINMEDEPVYEIARKVGFNDYKYFCSKFKKYTGYSITQLVKKK